MRNLVKITVLGLGLATAMISCTKDNQEMIELSEKKEIVPVKNKPFEKDLEIPVNLLPEPQPESTVTIKPVKVSSEEELKFDSREQNETSLRKKEIKKVLDMSIMREAPFIESLGNQILVSPKKIEQN